MEEHKIEPHKVTKPIQLLAAWLVGLIVTNGIFLTSAINLDQGSWERGALVVSAIVNVPLFLAALFLLQTRFRAELQEDSFYFEYISKKTDSMVRVDRNAAQDARLEKLERQITDIRLLATLEAAKQEQAPVEGNLDWSNWPVALNELHPRFAEIQEALRSAAIPLSDTFGRGRPPRWVISLSQGLPLKHKVQLLRVVIPFGFDGFQTWEPNRDGGETEDVYIGSYGGGKYAPVTPEFETLLKKTDAEFRLVEYLRRNAQSA